MTSEDFAASISQLIATLENTSTEIVETMAVTGKSLVQDRIQSQGLAGKSYTPLYAKAKFKRYGTGSKVDLTASGRMFQGIQVVSSFRRGGVFVAELGGTDIEVERKLDANIKRYGDFLQPNPSEQIEVDEIAQVRIDDIVRRFI